MKTIVTIGILSACLAGCARPSAPDGANTAPPDAKQDILQSKMKQLDRLLANPKDSEGTKRRFLCRDVGISRDRRAIPLLLKALRDPYVKVEFSKVEGVGAAHAEWYAVWREADDALRHITGANPVEQPNQRMPDYSGKQQETIRNAWIKWWNENAEPTDALDKQ